MKSALLSLVATLLMTAISSAADGWVSMFNGKDLGGWKSNSATEEESDVLTVKDGELVLHGGRSHLFHVGPDGDENEKDVDAA